jgi:hypothetical protein
MTPTEWKDRLDGLEGGGGLMFTTRESDEGECLDAGEGFLLVDQGKILFHNCDRLSRWCMTRVGLEPFGITAPSWGCSFRAGRDGKGTRLAYWQVGVDYIGIYLDDPDLRPRRVREDGRHFPSERGMWDRCFVIPDMPVPEDRPPLPDDLRGDDKRAGRRAWLQEQRPRRLLLDAMALAHFADWLLENTPDPGAPNVAQGT